MGHPEAVPPAFTPAPNTDDQAPVIFKQVLQDELACLNESRRARKVHPEPHPDNLIGLAFSGGGIRSATFNLGILQALAQNGLLHQFDYLSTVSGGGYTGSWLAALTRRFTRTVPDSSFADVEKALVPQKAEPGRRNEPPFLHWLRLYSNYLTPQTGAVSGDTWAMLGTWLRDLILNQTILGLIFISAFVLIQSALLPLIRVESDGIGFLAGGTILLFLASLSMAINVVAAAPSKAILETVFQRIKVTVTVMLPFVAACVLLNCALWQRTEDAAAPIWMWALAGAAFYFVVWGVVALMARVRRLWRKRHGKPEQLMVSLSALLVFSPVAGAAGGCLLRVYVLLLSHLPEWTSTNWVVVVFGSGIVMAIILLVGTLHLGLVGRGSMDLVREWWARLGGYLMLITLGWLLLAGTCAFAPLGVRWALFELRGWSFGAVLLWVVHNYLGLKAASSASTSGKAGSVHKRRKAGRKSGENRERSESRIVEALTSPRVMNAVAKV